MTNAPGSSADDDPTHAAAVAVAACEPGQTYGDRGRFTIVRELASGGMAHVYLADDQHAGQRVAFKVLRDAYRTRTAIADRFWLEGFFLCQFPSTHIPRGYAQGVDSRCGPWLTMELLEGKTLRELYGARSWNPTRVAAIGADIADAMSVIHAGHVIHRDLKPENLFITRRGPTLGLKILDWGLARMRGVRITETGRDNVALGTVRYMSPEQVRSQDVGEPSDIYSLCVVLYELLAGRFPYGDGNAAVIADRQLAALHLSGELVPLPSIRTDIPGVVWRAIEKGLERSLQRRYASMSELAEALRTAGAQLDATADTREMRPGDLRTLLDDMAAPSTRNPRHELARLYALGIDPRDLVDDTDPPPGSATYRMPALVARHIDSSSAPAEALRTVARLEVIKGPGVTRSFDVTSGSHVVGRGGWAHISIDEPAMSARHAIVAGDGSGKVFITDLGGRNGTTVSGVKLRTGEATELRSGDRIEMGRVILVLHVG